MTITVNSKKIELTRPTTIPELISSLGKNPQRCVVELNLQALPYAKFCNTTLKDGDILEIMQIVAGG